MIKSYSFNFIDATSRRIESSESCSNGKGGEMSVIFHQQFGHNAPIISCTTFVSGRKLMFNLGKLITIITISYIPQRYFDSSK